VKKTLVFLLAGSLILASSCRRDGGPSWDTGLVLPIAHTSMTIDNMIPDSLLATNADGSIKIVYSTNFPGLSTDTLLNIPDTTVKNSYFSPFNVPLNPSDFFPTGGAQQTTFPITNAQIVFGVLTQGHIIVQLKNDLRRRIILRYQIPCATKNSVPFDTSFLVPAALDSIHGYIQNASIDLAGYSVDFTGTLHNRSNTFTTIVTAQVDPTETPGSYTAYPPDTVAANCLITGLKPFYLRGYFGNQTIQVGPTENVFSFFKKVRSGSLGLDSLKMTLDIDNYIGMDARMTVNRIWSRNSNTNTTVDLSSSQLIGQTINVNRGQYSTNWPDVIPSSYHFQLDGYNSNAKALIENLPNYFGYDATLITNPLGNVSGNNDFLYAAHGIDATLNVEMPLNFFTSQLIIADTIIPSFASVKNRENVLDGQLTLHAANSFPFACDIQIYLLDQFDHVLDSIVAQPNRITAGQISWNNGYFSTVGFNNSDILIPLNAAKTVTLFNSSKIIIEATFETNSNPVYTKIFNTNQLNLQLNADFNYRVN
jgi:hypothetical protein